MTTCSTAKLTLDPGADPGTGRGGAQTGQVVGGWGEQILLLALGLSPRKMKLFFFQEMFCIFYLNQNSQAVKKECGPQKAMMKKDVKSIVAAKKWL